MRLRAFLYKTASLLGDVNAVARGKIVRRIVRKEATRATMRGLNSILRGLK